jgi:spermidine/putrescine transport system substrate-binding protein
MATLSGGFQHGDADPAFTRGITRRRLARRGIVGLGGLAAGGMVGDALAGCGASAHRPAVAASRPRPRVSPRTFWAGKRRAGRLDFANWPLYIDTVPTDPADHPTLDEFTQATGIRVDYQEVITDPDAFFRRIRPALAAGAPIGYDLMVMPNDQNLTQLMTLNYLAPLDHSRLPMFFANADPVVVSPSYDPGNAFTIAWQSGITGIAYSPGRVGRDVTSFEDLFNPAFTDRVGMFGDNRDLPNFTLAGMGIRPETSTPADWKKAAAKLRHQRDAGIVRAYYQQDYIDALTKGDIWLSMAWSGDIYQANARGADLRFVIPSEGGILWTDNLVIPVTAAHPVDALTYMNFVYQIDIAARLAESINYITPVPLSQERILTDANQAQGATAANLFRLANSSLIYPPRADLRRLSRYRVLMPDEAGEWNRLFESVYQ